MPHSVSVHSELHLVGEPVRIRDPGIIGPRLDQQYLSPSSSVSRVASEPRGAAPHDDVVVLGHASPLPPQAGQPHPWLPHHPSTGRRIGLPPW